MLLDEVKTALRVKTDVFDSEITALIEAAEADLRLAGINVPYANPPDGNELPERSQDPLIDRAVILYIKASFGYFEDDEKYRRAYDYLRCTLSLAGDYNAVE